MSTQRVIHVNDMKPGDTYIGRAVPRKGIWHDSPWANPFRVERLQRTLRLTERQARSAAVFHYDTWVRLSNDPRAVYIRTHLDELQGDLACWCRDKKHPNRACHGTVLLKPKEEAGL